MAETAYYDMMGADYASTGSIEPRGMDWASFGKAAGQVGVAAYGSAFSTGLSFVGSLLAGKQAKKASQYTARVMERNAQAAASVLENEAEQRERNAELLFNDILLAKQAQKHEEAQMRLRQDYTAGQTRAIIGASGLMMRGSPMAAYAFNLQQSERDILASRYKVDLQERALRDQALMEGYGASLKRHEAGERLRVGSTQSALARYGGSQQQFAATLGAFGNLASGGARTYAAYEANKARRGAVVE